MKKLYIGVSLLFICVIVCAKNPFVELVNDAVGAKSTAMACMSNLSNRLVAAMKLTDAQLADAAHNELSFQVGEYNVTPRSVPWNGWQPLMFVTPRDIDGNAVGYSNTGSAVFPAGWTYYPEGTATIVCPPDYVADALVHEAQKMSEGDDE